MITIGLRYEMKSAIACLLFLATATSAQCQLVSIAPPGPPDPHYCDRIKVEPNLTIEKDADVRGRVVDATGAPFSNSPVELRIFLSPTKQVPSKRVNTDADGNFHLESVKAGKYRLVASPTRAFQQPALLRCANKQCEFSITLQVNPTDLPDSQCPVR
jgi:hypothetical protein